MTVRRGRPSARVSRIIDMNGAIPVPVEMNRWVRLSSGSSRNLPFGPIIRIRCPIGSRHRRVVKRMIGTSRTYIS